MQRFKHDMSSEKTIHPISNLEESVRQCVFLRMMYFILSKLLLLRNDSTSSVRNTFFVSFVCCLSLLYTSFSVFNIMQLTTKTEEKNILGQHFFPPNREMLRRSRRVLIFP